MTPHAAEVRVDSGQQRASVLSRPLGGPHALCKVSHGRRLQLDAAKLAGLIGPAALPGAVVVHGQDLQEDLAVLHCVGAGWHQHAQDGGAHQDQRLATPPLAQADERLAVVGLAFLVRLGRQARDRELRLDESGHASTVQSASCRPGTWANSRVLWVTSSACWLTACAAIIVSSAPMGVPQRSRSARRVP